MATADDKKIIDEVEKNTPVVETEEEEKEFWSDDKMPKEERENTNTDTDTDIDTEVEDKKTDSEDENVPQATNFPADLQVREDFPSGKGNIFKTGTVVVAVLAIFGGGFWFYQSKLQTDTASKVAGESTEVSPTPEPVSDENEINFSDYNVQILNGSGVPGEAAKVQKMLEEQGFEDFTVGNAKSYSHKETEIAIVVGTPKEVLNEVKSSLGKNYTIKEAKELDTASDFDIVVIIGSKKAS